MRAGTFTLLTGRLGPTASMTRRDWVYSSNGTGTVAVPKIDPETGKVIIDPLTRMAVGDVYPGAGLLTLAIEHVNRKFVLVYLPREEGETWGYGGDEEPPTEIAKKPVKLEIARYVIDLDADQPTGFGLVAFSFIKIDAAEVYRTVVSNRGVRRRWRFCPCIGSATRFQTNPCRHSDFCEDFLAVLEELGLTLEDAGFQPRTPARRW